MVKFKFLILVCLIAQLLIYSKSVEATSVDCDNRYLTIVNPIRGRNLWFDKSLKPLNDLYNPIKNHNLAASWLVQYDVFQDPELLNQFTSFNNQQEVGVMLEVSESLAHDARVIYPYDAPWYSPRTIFLSGYNQSDRKRLIDKLFEKYHQQFNKYPKSVGAWWIDSYSLNYLKQRYGIQTALIVADQKTTDQYGVWGQWWGVPYYPSKANILTPASNLSSKQDVVVIQWALRDPEKAYGAGPGFSNYSLQANDYTEQGLKTDYFKKLTTTYLDCQNRLGQITVGLEVGQESVGNSDEFARQIDYLSTLKRLKTVTMEQFYEEFKSINKDNPNLGAISGDYSVWSLTPQFRENKILRDRINYLPNNSFSDYFISDKSDFLNRDLSKVSNQSLNFNFPYLLIVIILLGIFCWVNRQSRIWFLSLALSFISFGLIFRSHQQFGWWVLYSIKSYNLVLVQVLIILTTTIFVYLFERSKKYLIWILILSFGVDWLIQVFRYSYISGVRYLGISWDTLRFVGISWSGNINFKLVNIDLPAYQAAALLKIDFNKIWDNYWVAFLIYPLIHLILGLVIWQIYLRLNSKHQNLLINTLIILLILYIFSILRSDPRYVIAANLIQ